ncbi:M23 family metallopeptidase [Streptomyces sp. NPDC059578]|uniref:M23 family metallopeptidase n=1 Tax=Streptomyces sp. NPDC059578 TaxID=3346874 RepID=UPI0036A17EEB
MASNRPAPEAPYVPKSAEDGAPSSPYGRVFGPDVTEGETHEVWNPTADTVRPVRGRHRVAKQRGGLARSSTVLGVGVIAAVGAGGIATAQGGKPAVKISMPDIGSIMPGDSSADTATQAAAPAVAPLTGAGVTSADTAQGTTDAGEALRARIMQQAEQQQDQADSATRAAAEKAAVEKAAKDAAAAEAKVEAKKEAEAKAKKEAERKKKEAERAKAAAEAKAKAERERIAKLAKSFSLPLSSYTLTSTYGQSGAMWSSGSHTGLDFAAPTGTPLKAIGSGTITEAGWSGSYGYRTVLTLNDGTELWYAHQSSIGVSVGQKVTTGEVIGRVGGTGNVTGAHLHLEVHPGGGSAGIDPAAYLRGKGLSL